jgi:hypothetical protein
MTRRHPSLSLLVPVALALAACNKAPAEPDKPTASSAEPPAPAVAPLLWDAPGSWTKLPTPPSGPKKATYRIEKVGNDKEEAEMTVSFFGTGAKGDPAPNFKEWADQFDGNAGAGAKRDQFEVKGFKVETIEVTGTYKISLTPPAKGHKRSPVQMVKNEWRLYGAVVKTTDRGNWFFKLVGPDETVQSAKSAFRGMLETLR